MLKIIRRWWRHNPENHGVAVVGVLCGLLVFMVIAKTMANYHVTGGGTLEARDSLASKRASGGETD